MIDTTAIALDTTVEILDRAYAKHPHADEYSGAVHVTWCLRDSTGKKLGGAYATHAGAAKTVTDFPKYFTLPMTIFPCVMRNTGGRAGWICEPVTEALWPGGDESML